MKFDVMASLVKLARPSSLLVCETDGFSLRGAVLARSGNEVTVRYSAESRLPAMDQAVAELVDRLRSAGWRGKKAVLLTPAVVPALLELPVDPARPRAPEQMEELVRWEMEPMLMQHTTLWSVGRILVGLGYLTEEQARAVIDMQQGRGRPDDQMEVYSFKRFGDLAIELGYINRQQLDECLVRQEWTKTEGEEVACGWAAQHGAGSGEDGGYRWLASAVSRTLMQRWVDVFARHGVSLGQLYPLAGCAAAVLGGDEANRLLIESHGGMATATVVRDGALAALHMQPEALWMLLESHAGLVTATNLRDAAVTGFHMHQSSLSGPLEACLEAYHALTPPEPEVLWLAAVSAEAGDLASQLEQMLNRRICLLPEASDETGAGATPGMLGVARHALGLAGGELCSEVRVAGPRKPLMQRVEARAAIAALVFLAILGAVETALQVRMDLVETRKARVDKEVATLDASVASVKAEIDRIKQQQETLQAKRNEAAQAEARAKFFGEELPRRSAFLQSLLGALEMSVTEEVVVDRVEEIPVAHIALQSTLPSLAPAIPPGGFRVSAWALHENAAQQFVQAIKSAMTPWGMDIVEVSVVAQTGRLGLHGNAISLRIVKALPIRETPATSAGSKT
jgi:hypothetical protein